MQQDVEYVRGKLADMRKVRGGIAEVVRAVEIDRRTLDKLSDESHTPHITTVSKLCAYFKKADRRAKA